MCCEHSCMQTRRALVVATKAMMASMCLLRPMTRRRSRSRCAFAYIHSIQYKNTDAISVIALQPGKRPFQAGNYDNKPTQSNNLFTKSAKVRECDRTRLYAPRSASCMSRAHQANQHQAASQHLAEAREALEATKRRKQSLSGQARCAERLPSASSAVVCGGQCCDGLEQQSKTSNIT